MKAARGTLRLRRAGDKKVSGSPRRAPRSAPVLGNDEGTALVETALSLTLLLTILFGVLVMGLALYTYNVVAASAREATRFAIVRGADCTTWATACPASATDITNYVEQSLDFPGIDVGNLTVDTSWLAAPGAAACASNCNVPGNQVQVTVTYQFPMTIPFIPSSTLSLTSSSQMVISQ